MFEKIKDKIQSKSKILETLILISIFIIALFLRLYELGEIPKGIHIDEAGMAYDAYCIGNFGVDRYLNKLPVYLINYGGGQSALYAYIAAIFVRFLGIKTFAIRLPAVIVSMCALFTIYFIGRKCIGNKSAIVLLALVTINPWFIMASRWGLDCNLLAPCSVIATLLLFSADGKWYEYVISGIMIGITLYTYALSYIIIPIFLVLVILYMLYTKRITIKNVIILGIPIFILALPLILMVLVNKGIIPEINSFITIPKMFSFRDSEFSFGNVFDNIKRIKYILSFDGLTSNSIEKYGTVYYFTIPLIVMGIIIEIYKLYKNIKEKKFETSTGVLLFFISAFICFLIVISPNINRSNALYFPMIFFQYSSIKFLYKKMKKKFFYIIGTILVILYGYNFISFTHYYFVKYPVVNQYQFYFEDDLINAIATTVARPELAEKDVDILINNEEVYIYTLLVNKPTPYEFNEQKDDKKQWGRYVYNLEEIHDDMVYIIHSDYEKFAKELLDNGFENFFIGKYQIVYKSN